MFNWTQEIRELGRLIEENSLIALVLCVGVGSYILADSKVTFVFLFTVGAWWIDRWIKRSKVEKNVTQYADLSFTCLVSFAAQTAALIGVEDVTQTAIIKSGLIVFILMCLWLNNLAASTIEDKSWRHSITIFLCTVLSVGAVLIGPELLDILKGTV